MGTKSGRYPINPEEVGRAIGQLEGRMKGMEGTLKGLRTDVSAIKAQQNKWRGGLAVMAVLVLLSGALGAIITKVAGP